MRALYQSFKKVSCSVLLFIPFANQFVFMVIHVKQ